MNAEITWASPTGELACCVSLDAVTRVRILVCLIIVVREPSNEDGRGSKINASPAKKSVHRLEWRNRRLRQYRSDKSTWIGLY